jgi:hypothetical protein
MFNNCYNLQLKHQIIAGLGESLSVTSQGGFCFLAISHTQALMAKPAPTVAKPTPTALRLGNNQAHEFTIGFFKIFSCQHF